MDPENASDRKASTRNYLHSIFSKKHQAKKIFDEVTNCAKFYHKLNSCILLYQNIIDYNL